MQQYQREKQKLKEVLKGNESLRKEIGREKIFFLLVSASL
jgi:hypothetical protein